MTKRSPFRYFKTSPEVIRLAVMLYVRFTLSLRNVEDLLHERGIDVSHETIRYWWNRFGTPFTLPSTITSIRNDIITVEAILRPYAPLLSLSGANLVRSEDLVKRSTETSSNWSDSSGCRYR